MNEFSGNIYKWYQKNKRDLPWRETTDPYKIWISEIVLQQTRVAQGTGYYLRFIEQFPNVKSLASADEDKVLKTWQGLGYYSRARNLHHAAKTIVEKNNGLFPKSYPEILSLKGVGKYTAAAIASIAFGLPYPVVDGNIYRLFARYFGVNIPIDSEKGKKEIYSIASELIPDKNAGLHNQALMEFGALQCIPKSPDCRVCPLFKLCYASQKNVVDELPVKTKKIKQKTRFFYYYLFEQNDHIFFEKRTENDIWKNLYQFPLIESDFDLTKKEILLNLNSFLPYETNKNIKWISPVKKHILSHQVLFARLIHIEINSSVSLHEKYFKINKKDISKFAVPKLLDLFIQEINLGKNKPNMK